MNGWRHLWTVLTAGTVTLTGTQVYADASEIYEKNISSYGQTAVYATENINGTWDGDLHHSVSWITEEEASSFADVLLVTASSETGSGYMYDMLETDEERTFYDRLLACCNTVDDSSDTYSTTPFAKFYDLIDYERAQEVAWIFHYDHPEFFWMESHMCISSYSGISFYVYEDFQDGSDRLDAKEKISAVTDDYISGACAYATEYERVSYLYRTLRENVSYQSGSLDQSVASTFLEGKTVCAGYSKAYTLLCSAVGIEVVTLVGYNHGWNAVKLSGNWYLVDATNGYFLLSDEEMHAADLASGRKFSMTVTNTSGQTETFTFYMHDIDRLDYPVYYNQFPQCTESYAEGVGNTPVTTSVTTSTTTTTTVTTITTVSPTKELMLGDLNGDSSIDVQDASLVLNYYAQLAAGNYPDIPQNQQTAGDIDGDADMDIEDASFILSYYAKKAAGISVTWEALLSEAE